MKSLIGWTNITSGSRVSQKPCRHEIKVSSNFFHSVQTELLLSKKNKTGFLVKNHSYGDL